MLEWLPLLIRKEIGKDWPDDYVVIDTETTGLDASTNVPVSWGHVVVRNRQVVNRVNLLLNWFHPDAPEPARKIEEQMAKTRLQIERNGSVYPFTKKLLTEKGVHPVEALARTHSFMMESARAKMPVVAHNGMRFDFPFIAESWDRYVPGLPDVPPFLLLDTGLIEKGLQFPAVMPGTVRNTTVTGVLDYIQRLRGPVKWNLHTHCAGKYGLTLSVGDEAHTAGDDCELTRQLMEAYRERMAVNLEFEGAAPTQQGRVVKVLPST